MIPHRPADVEELGQLLRGRSPSTVAFTGSGEAPSSEVREALLAERIKPISLSAFDGIHAYEPRDLTVTVGTGMPLAELRAALAEQGQRLPPAEGTEIALPGTVGGLVAAAPAGASDHLLGPVRRHLLACRIVAFDGTASRWGRPVMKNVAGYALAALCAGSHGRLGALVEASLRTWPIPPAEAGWILDPGSDRPAGAAYGRSEGHTPVEATLELAASLASGPPRETPLPDALHWGWRPGGPAGGRLEARIGGTREAVTARGQRMQAWLAARGGRAERLEDGGGAESQSTSRPGGRSRPLREVVVRLSVPPPALPKLVACLMGVLERRTLALEAFPLSETLRCAWSREPAEAESLVRAVLAAAPTASLAVERGGPIEHAAVWAQRDPEAAGLEEELVRALAGGPRAWVADYL